MDHTCFFRGKTTNDKKVLLRERKRHTARRVVSTPSVVLPGYPPPGGGTWPRYPPGGTWPGTPRGGVPDPGTPPGGTWPGYPPGGTWLGYPPGGGYLTRVPPGGVRVPPLLPHGILGNVAKHYGIWVPPPVDRQIDGWTDACQNITFPRTTYAGGNKIRVYLHCASPSSFASSLKIQFSWGCAPFLKQFFDVQCKRTGN